MRRQQQEGLLAKAALTSRIANHLSSESRGSDNKIETGFTTSFRGYDKHMQVREMKSKFKGNIKHAIDET